MGKQLCKGIAVLTQLYLSDTYKYVNYMFRLFWPSSDWIQCGTVQIFVLYHIILCSFFLWYCIQPDNEVQHKYLYCSTLCSFFLWYCIQPDDG